MTELQMLQEQIQRKRRVESMLSALRAEQTRLRVKLDELDRIRRKEARDVEKREKKSLANFVYDLMGKRERLLDAEQKEAYAAAAKYEAAAEEKAAVDAEVKTYARELPALRGCEEKYAAALEIRKTELKSAGGADGESILRLEGEIARLESRQKELGEAIREGERASGMAENILSKLENAEDYAFWDLAGGGLFADMAKYDELDKAQQAIEELQVQLGRFQTELADVRVQADIVIEVDEFLRFADFFFDNIFTDLTVMDKIDNAKQQVCHIQRQLEKTAAKLAEMSRLNEQKCVTARQNLERLILQSETAESRKGETHEGK